MPQHNLSDEQWCVLDLLMRAKQRHTPWISRMELVNSPSLSAEVRAQLTWAALTMPKELIMWAGRNDFSISQEGEQLFNLRFGKGTKPPQPTIVADAVICLPGPTTTIQ